MSERSDFDLALEHLANDGLVSIYRRDVATWDRDAGRVVRKESAVVVAPPPIGCVGYMPSNEKIPTVFEFRPTDEQVIRLLNMNNVRDERLSAGARKLLKQLSEDVEDVPGTSEAQELHDTGCTRGMFSTSPGPNPTTTYVVEGITEMGEATLRASERAEADH